MGKLLQMEVKRVLTALDICREQEGSPEECWKCPMQNRAEGCMNALNADAAALIRKLAEGRKSQTPGKTEQLVEAVCREVCRFRHCEGEELEAHCMVCPLVQMELGGAS